MFSSKPGVDHAANFYSLVHPHGCAGPSATPPSTQHPPPSTYAASSHPPPHSIHAAGAHSPHSWHAPPPHIDPPIDPRLLNPPEIDDPNANVEDHPDQHLY